MPADDLQIGKLFGSNLREWRLRQNYSIQALARDLEVSKQVVSEWERGIRFPSQRNLGKIARYTGVPLCTFFRDLAHPCATVIRECTQSAETT